MRLSPTTMTRWLCSGALAVGVLALAAPPVSKADLMRRGTLAGEVQAGYPKGCRGQVTATKTGFDFRGFVSKEPGATTGFSLELDEGFGHWAARTHLVLRARGPAVVEVSVRVSPTNPLPEQRSQAVSLGTLTLGANVQDGRLALPAEVRRAGFDVTAVQFTVRAAGETAFSLVEAPRVE